MVARFEVDSAWLLQAVMHERAFKTTNTYPFLCMVFELCSSARVPVWNNDVIKTLPGIVDIGLIRDEAYELSPHRGPCQEVKSLG